MAVLFTAPGVELLFPESPFPLFVDFGFRPDLSIFFISAAQSRSDTAPYGNDGVI
jgi:hypothetical protein